MIETYGTLDTAAEDELHRLLGQEHLQEVTQMLTVYEERSIVIGKRDALLKLLRLKFGEVLEAMVTKIQALNTEAELDILLARVLSAHDLIDMGLHEAQER